ncbi:MAG: hypothetical protein IJ379_12760 [Lachnospiraceae bacterium]|nr:hypothetical protein [Lachnospiraceae bacterium]
MWKWVIRDYFTAFRWAKLKAQWKNIWFSVFYFGLMLPCLWRMFETMETMRVYLLIFIPMLFGFLSNSLHTTKLPKAMHICPIEESLKRSYIEKAAVFRICFVALLGMIGTMVLVICGQCDAIMAGVLMADMIMMSILLCGLNERTVLIADKPAANRGIATMVESTNLIFTLLSVFFSAAVLCWDTPVALWVEYIFVGFVVLVQIPLTVKLLTYWKQFMDRAVSYERSYL